MVIRHSIKELLAKSMVTRPMKCIVDMYLSFLNEIINFMFGGNVTRKPELAHFYIKE